MNVIYSLVGLEALQQKSSWQSLSLGCHDKRRSWNPLRAAGPRRPRSLVPDTVSSSKENAISFLVVLVDDMIIIYNRKDGRGILLEKKNDVQNVHSTRWKKTFAHSCLDSISNSRWPVSQRWMADTWQLYLPYKSTSITYHVLADFLIHCFAYWR